MSTPDVNPPVTDNFTLPPCCRVLPPVCRTRWGMAPGPCFRRVGSPSLRLSMSLFPALCSFFGLEAGQLQAFQPCGVRSNNLKLPVFFHFICSDGYIVVFMGFFFSLSLSSFAPFFFLIDLTTFCLLICRHTLQILHTPLRGWWLSGKESSC